MEGGVLIFAGNLSSGGGAAAGSGLSLLIVLGAMYGSKKVYDL